VENASLVPWIVLIALIHGLLVQRKAGSLHRSNLALALASYVLVIYGTFLTRSGVLADVSVHSFPAGSIYRLLVVILLLTIGVSVFALARRKGPSGKVVPWNLAWPLVLSLSVGLLLISATFVLIGTSWPMISFSEPAGRMFDSLGWGAVKESAIRPPWYNSVSLPLYVILFAFLAVGPFLAWVYHSGHSLLRKLLPSLAVATAGTGMAYAMGGRGAGTLMLFFVALAALTSNAIRLVIVARSRLMSTGAALAHLGLAVMFAGIVASSAWGRSATALLPLGEPTYALGHTLTFEGRVEGSEPQHRWRVRVQRDGVVDDLVELAMFQHGGEDKIFRKPGILRRLAGDLYVAPQSMDSKPANGLTLQMKRGTPGEYGPATLTFIEFGRSGKAQTEEGMVVRAVVEIELGDETERAVLPLVMSEDGHLHGHAVHVGMLPGVALTLQRIAVEQGLLLVQAVAPGQRASQSLTAEISHKPFIGFLWAGTILLSLGCTVAAARRVVDDRAARRLHAEAAERSVPLRAVSEQPQPRETRARKRAAS
jgi:cytochrome c-type biogenesis protein CcmF